MSGIEPTYYADYRTARDDARDDYRRAARVAFTAAGLLVTLGEVPALAEIEAAYCETSGTDDERRRLRAEFRAALAEHDELVAARTLRSVLPDWMWAANPDDIEPGDAWREVAALIEWHGHRIRTLKKED